jgi:hypothetical protein
VDRLSDGDELEQSLQQNISWHIIGKAVWDQGGDIRDVISIGKLVRKYDGHEEIEQMLTTMTKYGEIKEH